MGRSDCNAPEIYFKYSFKSVYLHNKKEFGKWLMDIAKYLTTAVLLSSVFNDIKESWVIYLVVSVAIVLTLLTGLLLVKDKKEEKEV